MKKLLGSTLALAMFLPTGANAELFKNLKISGQLDVQATSARNVTDFLTRPDQGDTAQPGNNDRIGDAHTRTMLSADWDLLDDVHARITLVKGGENSAGAGHDVYGENADTLDNVTARTLVQEANVKIDKLAGLFDTTIGRQFYGEPGDLIVYYGPRNAYGQRVDSLDAFRFDWKGEHMAVTAVAGRTADGAVLAANTGATTVSDVDLRGIVVSCTQHEMVKPSVYLYNRVTHGLNGLGVTSPPASVTGKNTNLYVAGLKAKVMAGGFSGHAEIAKNFGDDRTTFAHPVTAGVNDGPHSGRFTGYALLLKGGYKADIADVAAVNPWAEFGMGSGDANFAHAGNGNFQSINTDYRPGGIYGRFDTGSVIVLGGSANAIASNGLSNRVIWGVGVKATPAAVNKLTAGLAFYRYALHRAAPQATGVKLSRNIGSEVDVTAEWKHSDNVSLDVTLGSFLPGARVNDINGAHSATNPAQMAAADVKIRF
jgi:hypothetical protein